jgi:hypothetical protein
VDGNQRPGAVKTDDWKLVIKSSTDIPGCGFKFHFQSEAGMPAIYKIKKRGGWHECKIKNFKE